MTKQELETIKDYLNELVKFDFDKYITDHFPNTELGNVMFRECNAIEFKKLYKSIIKRFETLIHSDIAIMLPTHYSCNESFYDIVDVIEDLNNYLKRENNESIFDEIEKIFNYYVQFGNWDKNLIYKPSFSQEDIDNLAGETQLIQTKLNQENEQLEELINVYSELKKELDNKLAQSNDCYKTIKQKSKTATENDATIRSYLESSQANKNTIETLKTNITNLELKISDNIEDYRKRFEEVITQNTRSLSLIKEAEELQSEILSQRDTVENLIGAAADGSLGTHFKERKEQIRDNVYIFLKIILASLVATCVWIWFVFKDFDSNSSDWVHFVINVLRTLPAWFLVWWLIDRYTKERKLQEEYAFKSAIAMTMREHSKLLKNTDSGDIDKRDSQQIMLLKALENIYRNPDTRQDKEKDNLTPKNVEEFLSKLTELLKVFKFKN
nr:MAG TPA: nucleoporin [Caudoviricetes sp.]